MKPFRIPAITFFFLLFITNAVHSQDDPVNSPDSLYRLKKNASVTVQNRINLELARYYFLKNSDSVSVYVDLLEKALERDYDMRTAAFVKKFKGWLAQEILDTQKAIELAQEGLVLFSEIKDYREIGWMCMNLGTNYFRLGNYTVATEQYLQALGYFQQVNHQKGIADANNGLGRISFQTGHFQQAGSYFETALEIYERLHLEPQKPRIYNNLGLVLMEEGDHRGALDYMFKAAHKFKQINDLQRLALVYGNVAVCYDELQMQDSGMHYSVMAYEMSSDINDEYGILTGLINLGFFLRLKGDYDSSLRCFDRALTISKDKKLLFLEETVYKEYADLYLDRNDYKNAFSFHLKSDSIHNIITNDQTEERIEELLFSYQQELKEKELLQLRSDQQMQAKQNKILLLVVLLSFSLVLIFLLFYNKTRQQKQILKNKNIQLEAINEELAASETLLKKMSGDKDRLFSIIAHDLRNPIAAVNGFSELISETYDELDDETKKEYMEQLLLASRRTMSLLENLLFWARAQMQKIDIRRLPVDVPGFIRDSIEPLVSSADRKQIELVYNFEDHFSIEVDPEMMSVVIRNLVSNAIKFSFPGNSIVIKTFRENKECCICVTDQGTGIHPEVRERLFMDEEIPTSSGTNEEPGTGLGLIISRDFTERNGGNIRVESTMGKGTTFTICFPSL